MSASRTTSRSHVSYSSTATTRSSVLSLASTQRKLNKKEFSKCYADVCHLQHTHPLQIVKQHLDRGVLDFVGDRVKFDEWYPILSALRSDQSLHHVAIRLRHPAKSPLMEADTDLKARNATKQPVLTTKFVLCWLLGAVRKCLSQSPALTVLELDGLPLRGEFVAFLAQGVLETRSLQHLSLSRCGIQDDGATLLSMAVRNAPSIIGLDLSYCELTEAGAGAIAKLISHQKINRYSEAWMQTLRYRDPDVEAMPGLRRLTLNHNPDMGDRGVHLLVEEVRDDLWLRALDLQGTGLTDAGAVHLVQLVRNNPNLAVVDARGNAAMSDDSLSELMALLAINNADKMESEYKWLPTNALNVASRTSSQGLVLPPWNSSLRSKKPKSSSSGLPSSFTRSHSSITQKDVPSWRIQDQIRTRENDCLRHQIQELNDVLSHEVKQKCEIMRENENLKGALERCQLEKKQLEDDLLKRNVLNEETLGVVEETLSRLVTMCANNNQDCGNDDDIPELLNNMRAALSLSHPDTINNDRNVQLSLQPLKREKKPKNKKRNKVNKQVIWEEEEPPSNIDRFKKPDKKSNSNSTMKAQEIFAKMLNNQNVQKSERHSKPNRSHWRENQPVPASSEEESS